uniref:BRCT domain-containing protein n=1 Tax=Steinernema glaseri TaxID=37863 RepID=A0A1I7Z0K3_9BILA
MKKTATPTWLLEREKKCGPTNGSKREGGAPMPTSSQKKTATPTWLLEREKKCGPNRTVKTEPPRTVRIEPPRKIFYFTEFNNIEEKEELIRIVRELGGTIDAHGNGNPTHLVTPNMGRGMKILKAIARGLWLLIPDYVSDSGANGRFLEEEGYEHGQVPGKIYADERAKKLAAVCKQWRLRVANGFAYKNGAFVGWNVVTFGGPLAKGIAQVINLGGGTARYNDRMDDRNNDIMDYSGVKHGLFDLDENPLYERETRRLARLKIPSMRLDFPVEFLTNESEIVESEHYIAYYKTLLRSLDSI